jgi:hypothetical protein
MQRFIAKYNITWNYSTGYYPQANGLAEAFNKTLGKILKKTVTKNQRDWHDRLFKALWAYRVTVRTPTQATPYSLVYGSEAVLPLEVQLPSLRVAVHEEITNDEQIRLRFQELDALEEGRLQAVQNLKLYRQNLVRAYNKLVKQRVFRKGELVLVLRCPIIVTHKTKGKFKPKWEGPFIIEQAYDGGAYQLWIIKVFAPCLLLMGDTLRNTLLDRVSMQFFLSPFLQCIFSFSLKKCFTKYGLISPTLKVFPLLLAKLVSRGFHWEI